MNWKLGLAVGLAGLLSACAARGPERVVTGVEAMPDDAADRIAQVRLAGVQAEDGIDLQPLSDPLVADLVEAATELERQQDWRAADASLARALELSSGDPELLQWRAELALALDQLDEAVHLANRSWELGPQLGSLCRRNWAAIGLARELSRLPEAAALARAQGEKCTRPPPVRM